MIQVQAGTVNRVAGTVRGTRSMLVKTYSEIALQTGTFLPLERAVVEARVYQHLRSLRGTWQDHILIPQATLTADRKSLLVEMYKATPLRFTPASEWPFTRAFSALGQLAGEIAKTTNEDQDAIFNGLEEVQKQTGQAVRDLKALGNDASTKTILCLGDFGLSNIAACGGKLLVYDFEFARREAPGFDIGQLLAELRAFELTSRRSTRSEQSAVLDGYISSGQHASDAEIWAQRLSNYYLSRYILLNETL